ncbi:hypothetical protein H8E88_17405 [candidate division KSB1 bacterium]|nr:hypothetical protein [candidate division KSB1 bacterium]MBL7094137.1 hypothetical protein [candidate division KSB1 bacterium]
MKVFPQFILFLLLAGCLIAQENEQISQVNFQDYKPNFESIENQFTYPGKDLVIKLKAHNQKRSKLLFSFSWSLGGKIDQTKNEFHWRPREDHVGIHPIIFTATDSLTNQNVNQPAIITVKPIQYAPTLKIKSNRPIPEGFWEIQEGEDVALVVEAGDRNKKDQLSLDYYIEKDTYRKLKNARYEVNDQVATFLWTPNNLQAKKKYFNITFRVRDNTGLMSERTIPILVKDVPHVPVFNNKNKEYFIDEGEMLTFTVKAFDGDDEPISYKMVSSEIKYNDYYFDTEKGLFQWKPTFEYARRKSDYLLILSASDYEHTIFDTILVKVDPKNYPPEMEQIRDREIREGEELIIQLSVKDKNGDENLIVTVAESDMPDFSFDEIKREFRWKPSYDFVKNRDKRNVYAKFKVTDSYYSIEKTAKIVVYDRENPAVLQTSYLKNIQYAKAIFDEVSTMDREMTQSLTRKRKWNTVFDISNIMVGAFVVVASSSLASKDVQQSAVPIGATITALIGIRSVLDKSDRNLPDMKTRAVLLMGNIESLTNSMVREYGKKPSLTITDTQRFKNDLKRFKDKIENYESQKEKLRAELSIN